MARWAKVPGSNLKIWVASKADVMLMQKLASQGMSKPSIASIFKITPVTLVKAMDRDENLAAAWAEGVAEGEYKLVKELWDKALDKKSRDQLQAIKFILERRMGWTEKQTVESVKSKPSKIKMTLAKPPTEDE